MTKKLKSFVYTAFLIILASCLLITKKINEKNKTEAIIANTPEFTFLTLNNILFSNRDLDMSKKRIIMNYFNPNCEHCQYMAGKFIKDSQKIKDLQILMITSSDSSSTKKFSSDYKLSLLPNIVILRDTNYQFQKTFGTAVSPSFFIYRDNILYKKIIGETRIENLTD